MDNAGCGSVGAPCQSAADWKTPKACVTAVDKSVRHSDERPLQHAMNTCNIVGRIMKAKVDTNKNGKRVGKVRIEVSKKYGDQTYTTRFDCHVYGPEAEAAGALPVGAIAWASGEVQAYVHEYNGKTYANLQLTGRVGAIEAGNFEEHKPQPERPGDLTKVAQSPKPQAAAAEPGAPPPEEEDVPF